MTVEFELLDLDALARRLRVSKDWWFRHRRALEGLGFPAPVKGIPNHWDPVAIRAWLDSQLPDYARKPATDVPTGELVDFDAMLAARARGEARRTD